MAAKQVDFLLVGGGMASAHCAAELRRLGADGEILLVGREPHVPYERPPLSKEYLRGEATEADAEVHPESWYGENDVELRTSTNVLGFDAKARTAKLQGGDEVSFEKALLATGARVNILRVDGAQLDGIHYLRALANSDSIREDAESADHVVLIGGSYIGTEVAASLTAKGSKCTIVMMEDVALSKVFGEEPGRFFHELLESKGVEIVGGETLDSFLGDGRVSAVRTESGREIECDCVVVGAGVHPEAMLAERGGLEVENGVVCDATLQSSVEGIYAAGDCCNYESAIHGERLRIEHWDVAMQQGQAAAGNLLGAGEEYRVVPYFFSDLADWSSLEYVGPAYDWDEIVWRGDRDSGQFMAWYLKGGKVAGALSVDRSEDLGHARRLLETGADVSDAKDQLGDPDSDLEAVE